MILALCTLALVGLLTTMENKTLSPRSTKVTNAESQAVATAGEEAFQPVDQMLQLAKAQTGTYVGAELPVGNGVTVAQASATSYCLQVVLSGVPVHEDGPGGTPAVGAC